jgi:hypothetical protein
VIDEQLQMALREDASSADKRMADRLLLLYELANGVDLQRARTLDRGDVLYHVWERNADGSPVRCRVMGKLKEWKRDSSRWQLPVKHGMYQSFYIHKDNAIQWRTREEWAK